MPLLCGLRQNSACKFRHYKALGRTRWDYFDALGETQMTIGDYGHAAESYEKGIEGVQRFLSSNPANGSVILKSDRDLAQAGCCRC